MACLTGEHEIVEEQTTEALEGALVGYFNLPQHLWPNGFRMSKKLQEKAAEQMALLRILAHNLMNEMSQVGIAAC